MRITLSLVVAGALCALLGCGEKGPLVLPDAQHPHRKIGIGKQPPASAAPAAGSPSAQAPISTTPPSPGTDASGPVASPPQP